MEVTMRLAVIGTGYVGLVIGAGFSEFGHQVVCVDCDRERVTRLKRGQLPIYEPGLEQLVLQNQERGTLRFTDSIAEAIAPAEVAFIAVGTPANDGGDADLSAVFAAVRDIAQAVTRECVVVVKSTVPVGTCRRIEIEFAERCGFPVSVVSNPEFLKEGAAVTDFMRPDRVVVGTASERGRDVMSRLYAPLLRTSDRLHFMDLSSAELTKYASNALLAVRISFMNELACLAERVGADIEHVRRGIGSDPRIGPKFLYAGAGYGGSCFPKDLKALLSTANRYDIPLELVRSAERANRRQKMLIPEKIERHFASDLRKKRIALWGLAFKPNTDDVREAPALVLIEHLFRSGAEVVAFDPAAGENARERLGERLQLAPGMYQAAEGADALVLMTEWHLFRQPDFRRLFSLLRSPIVFDGRNVWDPQELRGLGFTYYGIGRR
jgi:UDPglucose 6-dehydrogenase